MNDKNIQKPITVIQTELANKIIESINDSGLHPVVIMPVIEEVYFLMKNTVKETREKEKIEYEKSIMVVANNSKNDESK